MLLSKNNYIMKQNVNGNTHSHPSAAQCHITNSLLFQLHSNFCIADYHRVSGISVVYLNTIYYPITHEREET